jgi:hypothetical protein
MTFASSGELDFFSYQAMKIKKLPFLPTPNLSVIPAHAGIYLFLLKADCRPLKANTRFLNSAGAPSGMTRVDASLIPDRKLSFLRMQESISSC